jgi:dipeptidyl aminopeptidase/acylaminoacyl peptidase
VDYAKALQCPVLFMHGSDDPRATVAEGRRVFDAVPGSKTFKILDGTGHEPYVLTRRVEWTASVGAFMKEAANKPLSGAT